MFSVNFRIQHYNDCIPIKDIRPNLKNINVIFIILEVGSATVTKENRVVRTFKVGDPTACINVSVWDEPGNLLAPGDIVRLTKGYASIWRHCLTLYSGKNGDIIKIGDFCFNFNEHLNMSDPNMAPMQPGTFPSMPLGQKNQVTANNGAPSNNNGNSVILSVTTTPSASITIPSPSTVTPPAVPAPTVKVTASNRNSGENNKSTTGKTTARGSRSNQSRGVKSDRR